VLEKEEFLKNALVPAKVPVISAEWRSMVFLGGFRRECKANAEKGKGGGERAGLGGKGAKGGEGTRAFLSRLVGLPSAVYAQHTACLWVERGGGLPYLTLSLPLRSRLIPHRLPVFR